MSKDAGYMTHVPREIAIVLFFKFSIFQLWKS